MTPDHGARVAGISGTVQPEPHADPAVVKEVLRYFIENPHAADDLEGITRWRLVEHQIRRRVEETRQALTWLVERDFLQRAAAGGAAPIFTLNPDKADAARALVGDAGATEAE